MSAPLLATKLYVPPSRPKAVARPRLTERLNDGLRHGQGFARRLTLISAPAGFGETALVGQWVSGFDKVVPEARIAWLSLDEADGDPVRFLAYVIAAVQTTAAGFGASSLLTLQRGQPPPVEATLTTLLNEMAAIPVDTVLVLDDYHLVDSPQVDRALAFLVEHLPPHLHLAIAARGPLAPPGSAAGAGPAS